MIPSPLLKRLGDAPRFGQGQAAFQAIGHALVRPPDEDIAFNKQPGLGTAVLQLENVGGVHPKGRFSINGRHLNILRAFND